MIEDAKADGMTSGRVGAEAFAPGEFIREELEERWWTWFDLGCLLGMPEEEIGEIIAGRRAITPEIAMGLGEAFGTGAQFWANLEDAYRRHLAARDGD